MHDSIQDGKLQDDVKIDSMMLAYQTDSNGNRSQIKTKKEEQISERKESRKRKSMN